MEIMCKFFYHSVWGIHDRMQFFTFSMWRSMYCPPVCFVDFVHGGNSQGNFYLWLNWMIKCPKRLSYVDKINLFCFWWIKNVKTKCESAVQNYDDMKGLVNLFQFGTEIKCTWRLILERSPQCFVKSWQDPNRIGMSECLWEIFLAFQHFIALRPIFGLLVQTEISNIQTTRN